MILNKLSKLYSKLFESEQFEIDDNITYVSYFESILNNQINSIILFDSDMVHCGDASKNEKVLLFFYAAKEGEKNPSDLQLHGALLAQMLYGISDEFCELVYKHDNAKSFATSLKETFKKNKVLTNYYNNWLKTKEGKSKRKR